MAENYIVEGFRVNVQKKQEFDVIGWTRFVKLNGKDILEFIRELTENGQLDTLHQIADDGQQILVCLSDREGHSEADCRCTVCVQMGGNHEKSEMQNNELYTLHAPESEWLVFEVGEKQSPDELHTMDVYKMAEKIGYTFNWNVGFHLDNQHEWEPGKTMKFLMPVIKK